MATRPRAASGPLRVLRTLGSTLWTHKAWVLWPLATCLLLLALLLFFLGGSDGGTFVYTLF